MTWDAAWALVLGAAITLAGTIIAQWVSLSYQTRRQWEVRRADFQRTTLIQLRDMLGEVEEAVGRALAARQQLRDELDRPDIGPSMQEVTIHWSHPDMEAVHRLTYRLRLLGVGLEHEPLRTAVERISRWAAQAPASTTDEGLAHARHELYAQQIEAVRLLGERLRRLS